MGLRCSGFRQKWPKRIVWLILPLAVRIPWPAAAQEKKVPEFRVPAGLDSALAAAAWRSALLSLVPVESEIQAARLKAGSAERFRAARRIQDFLERNPGEPAEDQIPADILELLGGRLRGSDRRRALQRESRSLLESVRDSLQSARAFDPLDAGLAADLAWVHSLLDGPEDQEKAVVLLHSALELDRGNPDLFRRLADVYVRLSDWTRAAEQYKSAYETLRGFEFLSGAGADTAASFEILMALGNAYIQSLDGPQAERTFQEASRFSRTPEEAGRVQESIALIQWAGGDILARQMFAEADRLTREGKNEEAAERYRSVLKRTRGKSDAAFWEASYLLGLLETSHLRSGPGTGLDRLMSIAEEAGKSEDPALARYRDSYGILLFNEAMKRVKDGVPADAMQLLEQGALTRSFAQGRSSLELVKLIPVPKTGFLWGIHALRFSNLTAEEQKELWVLMRSISRKLDLPEVSRYFHAGLQAGSLSPATDPESRFALFESLRCGAHFLHQMISPLSAEATTLENLYKEMALEALAQVDPARRSVLMESLQNTFRAIDESWMQNSRQSIKGEWP